MQVQRSIKSVPFVTMVVANLLPLYGVAFLGWSVFYILLLYWSENVIIGFYNILKMAAAQGGFDKKNTRGSTPGKFMMIPFFIIHYGGFVGGHGLFIMALSGHKVDRIMGFDNPWPCFLVFVQLLLNVIRQVYVTIPPNMKIAILALFISHGVGFVHDYILKGEYKKTKIGVLMAEPYKNIVLMHIAIIFGAFLTMKIGEPIGVLLIIVIGKTFMDSKLYLGRQKKKADSESSHAN